MISQLDRWHYAVLWEFVVKSGKRVEFEAIYGPDGDWAQLFRTDPNYVRTDLLARTPRYLTLDLWTSQAAYEEFKREHAAEYHAIDHKCELLTESEREIGTFTRVTEN